MTDVGMRALAAGIAILSAAGSSIGQGFLVSTAIAGMARNPAMSSKLRSSLLLGCALVEGCGIYALLVAILIIFVM